MSLTELFANQPFGIVTSGGTDLTSTSWTVTQNPSAPFPTAQTGISQFHVTDTNPTASSEIIAVTNVAGTAWTVTRGAEGTSPVVHEAGFTVTQVLTAGWLTGITGASLPATSAGAILYGNPSASAAWLAGNTTSAKQFLTSTGSGGTANSPQWGTIATSDVPVLNQNTTGTAATAGNVTGVVAVLNGGTGGTSATTYAVLTGGTAATSPFQQVVGLGTAGQALTSNGAGSLPSWQQTFMGLMEPLASPVTFSASPYSAAAGQYVPVDTTNGSVTVNLPHAPADKSIVGIKQVIQGGQNTVTWVATGGDVINKTGGGTQGTLTLASQGVIAQYMASNAIWYVYSDDLPLGQLDNRYVNWVNAKGYGATGNGSTDDSAAVAAAITAAGAGTTFLPAGTYLFNSSTIATLSTTGARIIGDGPDSTYIKIGASFSGTQAIFLNAEGCAVENLSVAGATSTTTSNPAADAIYLNGQRFSRVSNVEFEYINGWCVNTIATASNAPYASMLTNLSSYKNCAGGIHVKSNTNVTWAAQVFLANINMQQIGIGGTTATSNLDAFRFEDCFDITASNFNAAVSDAGTGSTISVTGKCASHYFTNMDLGAFPNATSMTNAVITIQDSANGSPSDIRFVQGEAQQGANGLLISGGASNCTFTSYRFFNNYGSGARLTGTGNTLKFLGCAWSTNGQGGTANSGTYYDLEITSTATGIVTNSTYSSPVVSVGSTGVQNAVAIPTTGQAFSHIYTDFKGTGTPATPFTHVPGLFVRQDTVPPQWNGRMEVLSGQTTNSGFLALNSAASPTVPFSQFQAKNGTEQTLGVSVTGDTQQRLLLDSNGKMLWGAGGTVPGETNLYRAGAGTLQTDGNFAVGTALTIGTPLAVTSGGSGLATVTSYAVITGGTSSTTPLQQVSGLGTTGQSLCSNGAAALPTWQTPAGRILNLYHLAPTTQAGYGINSTTPAAFGSGTIATQSFTAPPSGNVLATFSFALVTSAAGVYVAMYLSPAGSTTTISSDVFQYESPSAGFAPVQAFPFYLTGLASGNSYNFDLVGSVTSGQSGTIVAYTQTSYPPTLGTNAVRGGPVIVTIQAL